MKNNKGITITSLIITIIVMVILAGIALLFSVGDSGVISRAEKTQFLEDMKLYKEELELYKGQKQIENQKSNLPLNTDIGDDFNESDGPRIKNNYIPSMKSKYYNKLIIEAGELVFISSGDKEEEAMAESVGLIIQRIYANIQVEIQGQGTIEGLPENGEALRGETINLKAIPGEVKSGENTVKYEFAGWYENGEKVKDTEDYSFEVAGNRRLVAKFTSNATIIYLDDGSIDLNTNNTISGYSNREDIVKVEVGSQCTTIANKAFSGCTNLALISLPSDLEIIESRAFENCINLEMTEIPKKVISIGNYAFLNCKKIIIDEIPESVTTLGQGTFDGCIGITKLKINNFSSIGGIYISFVNCTGLEEVTLGDINKPVSKISDGRLFENCIQNNLTIKVYVASGIISLANDSWGAKNATTEYYDATTGKLVNISLGYKYRENTEINFSEIPNADKITNIKSGAFFGCTNLELTTLPENLLTINNSTFYGCKKLKISRIPEKITSIGAFAFRECISLTNLSIPNVENIKFGDRPFLGCTNLTEVTLGDENKPVTSIPAGLFSASNASNLRIKVYVESGTTSLENVPWGATDATIEYYDIKTGKVVNVIIGKNYKANTEISWEKIPNEDKVTEIRSQAFMGCTNLALISLPENVSIINNSTFNGCKNLKINRIPEKITSIGAFAFRECTSLTNLSIPNVENIKFGDRPFLGCTNLTEVTLGDKNKPVTSIPAGLFSDSNASNLTIKVYVESGTTSLENAPWGVKKAIVVYLDSITGEEIK